MSIQNGNFIEIEYLAIDKESGKIFDLTSEQEAKKANIYDKTAVYGPRVICIGESQVIPGLESSLIGKETNKEFIIEINPEEGFGKKDPKLMKIIPTQTIRKQKIQPYPGLKINIDGYIGTIRIVSGGRTIVDFNHPLAGHHLIYKIKVNKIIENDETKLKSILEYFVHDFKIELINSKAEITTNLPDQIQNLIKEKTIKLIPAIKEVVFIKKQLKNN